MQTNSILRALRWSFLSLLLGCACLAIDDALAQEPPLQEPPLEEAPLESPIDAAHAMVVLAPERPLVIRVDLKAGAKKDAAKSLQEAWRNGVLDEFKRLDADNSGALNNDELAKAPWIRQQTETSLTRRLGVSQLVSRIFAASEGADEQEDMSLATFTRRRSQRSSWVQFKTAPVASLLEVDRLWRLLDKSGDLVLDADEAAQAAEQTERVDVNANRWVESNELRALDNPMSANQGSQTVVYNGDVRWVALNRSQQVEPKKNTKESDGSSKLNHVAVPQPLDLVADLASRMAVKYESIEFKGISGWESLVERFDGLGGGPKDGKLDQQEWQEAIYEGMLPIDAHCEVVIRANGDETTQPNPQLRSNLTRLRVISSNADVRVVSTPRTVFIRGAGAILHMNAPTQGYDPLQNVAGTFDLADGDKNEYLELKEAQRYYPLNVVFTLADADSNGMLYKEELDAYIVEVRRQQGLAAEVIVQEQGRMLFPAVDTNGDHALDVRERRAMPQVFASLDANSDGSLQASELPLVFEIGFRPAQPEFMSQISFQQPLPVYQMHPSVYGKAPNWFKLLDRNKDGVLERAEYPGKGSQFKKLDANGDGLITPQEAT